MNNLTPDLLHSAQTLGLTLDERQTQSLLTIMAQMQKWNKTYNLTALKKPEQILVQHVLDSLSVLTPIQRFSGSVPNAEIKLVDVGSGAGLPGMVLAVMQPQWQVFCVDAVEKKMAFVRHVGGVLGLSNLNAVHGRIEQLPAFDAQIVVSRAFASLPDFVQLAGSHVARQGRLLAMKGAVPEMEIQALAQTHWQLERIEKLNVPQLDAQRCLIWLHRQENP